MTDKKSKKVSKNKNSKKEIEKNLDIKDQYKEDLKALNP